VGSSSSLVAVLVAVLAVPGGAARGDELPSRVGVAVTVGGGVERAVGDTARDAIGPAAVWEVRGAIATRVIVSTELAYQGSVSTIERGGGRGTLRGAGLEVAIRVNVPGLGRWRPYLFTGRALRWYSVRGDARRARQQVTSPQELDGQDSDVVIELPIGVGCAVRAGGLILDTRVALRASGDAELLVDRGSYAALHVWSGTLRAGFEF
jgi:hypothetical protein